MSGYLTVLTPGLPMTIASAFKFATKSVYGADGEFDGVVVDGAQLVGVHEETAVRSAITALEAACRPGGVERATVALTKLRAKTAARPGGLGDQHITGQAYAEQLSQYPADIIEAACKRWADGSRWWPAWAELKQECDRLSARRRAEHRALLAALQRMTTPARSAIEAPKVGATAADRVRDLIAYRKGKGDLRGAALEERWLAQHQRRDVEAWARPLLAEIEAAEARRRQEFAALATEKPAPAPSGNASLGELAKQARERLMGSSEAA